MNFSTSQINLTSQWEKIVLNCFNKRVSGTAFDKQILSRITALFFSAVAAIDFSFHGSMTIGTSFYSLGRSIVCWNFDMSLPWEHLQRVRDAVFPILFGSIVGIIHPYLGVYAVEPTRKHIGYGILSSQTAYSFETVCSPSTTLKEIDRITEELREENVISRELKNLVTQAKNWETSLERVQSIDFFHFRLTTKILSSINHKIESTNDDHTWLQGFETVQ